MILIRAFGVIEVLLDYAMLKRTREDMSARPREQVAPNTIFAVLGVFSWWRVGTREHVLQGTLYLESQPVLWHFLHFLETLAVDSKTAF